MALSDFVLLDRMGFKAGWAAQTLVNRGGHGQIGIHSDQVHESKGTHAKTHRFHQAVQVLGGHAPIADQAQAFGIIGPGHSVHNKTGGILGVDDDFAHGSCQGINALGHIGQSQRSPNHFHQFHHRGWIKKMQTDHPLGSGQALGKLFHRDGGGVTGQDRFRSVLGFHRPKESSFDRCRFDHRFDKQIPAEIFGAIAVLEHGFEALCIGFV